MLWIDIDEQVLDKQAERNGKEGTASAQNSGPDNQGQETQCGRKPDRCADHTRLDDGLDDEVHYRVDNDNDNRRDDVLIKESNDRRRHQPDNEADVRDIVRNKCKQATKQGITDVK